MRSLVRLLSAAIMAAILGAGSPAFSQTTIRINLGTVAPDGSLWHNVLLQIGKRWKTISKGLIDVHVYPGGLQGDEADLLRAVNVGEALQGAGISGVGLARIAPGVGALQMPMLIDSYAQLDHVRAALEPKLEKDIADKGYIVLHWSDVGWVHFFSKRPVHTPADLKPMKLFINAGDPNTDRLYKELGFRPVVAPINELTTALATGTIEAFDVPPLFALAGQSFGEAKNMMDMNWAPVIGATIISKKTWDRIPQTMRPELLRAARDAGEEARAGIRKQGEDAVAEMQKYKLNVVTLTAGELEQWRTLARSLYPTLKDPKMKDSMIPAEYFDEALRLSEEARKEQKKQ